MVLTWWMSQKKWTMFSGRVSKAKGPKMTIRSKQWYTKASRLPNSLAKISIGRLRLFLLWQQDDRPDDRWNQNTPPRGPEREERVQGKETAGCVPLLSSRIRTAEKGPAQASWLSEFQKSLGRLKGASGHTSLFHWGLPPLVQRVLPDLSDLCLNWPSRRPRLYNASPAQ